MAVLVAALSGGRASEEGAALSAPGGCRRGAAEFADGADPLSECNRWAATTTFIRLATFAAPIPAE